MTSIRLIPDDMGLRHLRQDNIRPDTTLPVGTVTSALPVSRSTPGQGARMQKRQERRKVERRKLQRRYQQQLSLLDTRSDDERRHQVRRKNELDTRKNKKHIHIDVEA